MKDILIVAHYTSIPKKNAVGRFNVIATKLSMAGYHIELVTSSFEHSTKMQIDKLETEIDELPYKLTLISEPGYKRNVSIRRILSHKKMAFNLKKYLKNRKIPDLVYCAIPSIDVAYITAKYCKKKKVKLVVDVQDLWPEAFNMVLPFGKLNTLLTYPLKCKADRVYKSADQVITVSETYKRRIQKVVQIVPVNVVYLGIQMEQYEISEKNSQNFSEHISNANKITIGYCGTLGHSYDLKCVMDAISNLKVNENVYFLIMGDGPLRKEFEKYAKEKQVKAIFTGMLSLENMIDQLKKCDILVNPIVKKSVASIINKHATYAMAGLPVLNTQECDEYMQLVENEKMGLNSPAGDYVALADNMRFLIEHPQVRKKMGENGRKLAYKIFDRRISYQKIVLIIEECLKEDG